MKFKPLSKDLLLSLTSSIFTENNDLSIALVGGLPIQGLIAPREVRKTSDIDIVAKNKNEAEMLVKRYGEKYNTYYNSQLDKYSVYKWEEGIHMDVYPGKIGLYKFDDEFWKRRILFEKFFIFSASLEDLISLKLYSYIVASKGKEKHMIDIYSILLGKYEIDVFYLRRRLSDLSNILGFEPKYFVDLIKEGEKKIFNQFSKKERNILSEKLSNLLTILYH